MYAKTDDNGAVIQYPYSTADFKKDHPTVSCRPRFNDWADDALADFNIVKVAEVAKPSGDVVTEMAPEYVSGVLTQQWSARAYTVDEAATKLLRKREGMIVPALDAMLAIDQFNLSAAYESWANDPARTFAEKAFITKALYWKRLDPVLISGAEAMGLTDEQLDGLFEQAMGAV